ncbi:Pentatricopeptide repeat-containing protein [Sesamum angolense]|uniref:Pentatricopeptide repeat-containing protein n=1 Tax=Sesamum angolense TaxID=2727404 RepID=A0AAE1T3Y6_9LAMI|nr:Pentatricopeptide repeat-containing protein [Sesamum angolense]
MFLRLSTKLLNISIASLCRAKQLEKAEAAIIDGIRLGVLPDVVTYNTLITGYCQFVGFDAGYCVIHRMKEAGINPDVVTYNSLMAGHKAAIIIQLS